VRCDLGVKRRQGFAEARNVGFEASAHAGMAGMFEPVGFRSAQR